MRSLPQLKALAKRWWVCILPVFPGGMFFLILVLIYRELKTKPDQ